MGLASHQYPNTYLRDSRVQAANRRCVGYVLLCCAGPYSIFHRPDWNCDHPRPTQAPVVEGIKAMLLDGNKQDWSNPLLIALDMKHVTQEEEAHMKLVDPRNPDTAKPMMLNYGLTEELCQGLCARFSHLDPSTGRYLSQLEYDELDTDLTQNLLKLPQFNLLQGGHRLTAAYAFHDMAETLAAQMAEYGRRGDTKAFEEAGKELEQVILNATFLAAVFPGKWSINSMQPC